MVVVPVDVVAVEVAEAKVIDFTSLLILAFMLMTIICLSYNMNST